MNDRADRIERESAASNVDPPRADPLPDLGRISGKWEESPGKWESPGGAAGAERAESEEAGRLEKEKKIVINLLF